MGYGGGEVPGGDLPTAVQIEISRACNAHCVYCHYAPPPDGPLMPWELFERALPLVSEGCAVALYGRGEPLLHPRFLEMVEQLTARGAAVSFSTNGVALTEDYARALARLGIKSIDVSIWHCDPEVHSALQGLDSDLVWANLQAAARVAHTGIATVPLAENIESLLPFIDRAIASGAAYVRLLREMVILPDTDLFHGPDRERARALLHAALAYAKERGLYVHDRVGDR